MPIMRKLIFQDFQAKNVRKGIQEQSTTIHFRPIITGTVFIADIITTGGWPSRCLTKIIKVKVGILDIFPMASSNQEHIEKMVVLTDPLKSIKSKTESIISLEKEKTKIATR